MFDFLMWSSLVLDNIIKIAFVGAGATIIYAALKLNKKEAKTIKYSVTIKTPNLTKEEAEQLAERVVENMNKRRND